MDALFEFGLGHLGADVLQSGIPSTVKSALTRQYNKGDHKTPFANIGIGKASAGSSSTAAKPDTEEALEDDVVAVDDAGNEEVEIEEKEDLSKNKMLKMKKPSAAKGGASKGKGKGKAAK